MSAQIRSPMNLLSRYTLLERIGNSVLGTVYKAQDKANGSLVTLRVLQLGLLDDAARAELEARLQRDFEAADRLQHPGIARVFEMRREGHTALIASELVDGPTVTSFVRASGGSELSQVVTAVGQVLEALDFAHRQGVIHRDLRPANVRVQGERIKITDFGMADLGAGARDDTPSLTDRTEYMAPEQLESGSVDKRCDVHAVGAILYELLTGRSPFAGEADGLTAMFRVMNFVPLPPSQVRPGLASAFDRVVQRALAKSPGERFASAQQFRDELRGAYSTLMRRPPPDTLVRSVFAAHYPPAASPAAPSEPSLTSPLPEDFLAEKPSAQAAASEAAARGAPEKAAAAPPAASAPSLPSGNTLPGSTAAPVTAAPAREVTSRSQRPETPARVSDTQQKATGTRADASRSDAVATPERDKSARRPETRVEAAPARQPEARKPAPASPAPPPASPAATSSDLKDLLRGAVPVAAVAGEPGRAKEPEKAPPVSGGTVLAPPKRAATPDRSVESARPGPVQPAPPPAAPAKDADKGQPVAGGTVLTPAKRSSPPGPPARAPVAEAERAKPLPGSTEAPLPSSAAAPPAEKAPEPADEAVAEAARAKQFERTIWIPVPKDDSGVWRGPPAAKPSAPVRPPPLAAKAEGSPASTPPPRPAAPTQKKVIPLTEAAVAHGGKVLARFMGPIAMVLSRRAAQEFTDEKAFFDALAGHLNDADERYQFLREVRQRPS